MSENRGKYLVMTEVFLERYLRTHFLLNARFGNLSPTENAEKLKAGIVVALGAYLGHDAWVTDERPGTDLDRNIQKMKAEEAEQVIQVLRGEIEAKNEEIRRLRFVVNDMADGFNLLTNEVVKIGEDGALSHAEKRGALKFWRHQTWEFIRVRRDSLTHSTDSEIPF